MPTGLLALSGQFDGLYGQDAFAYFAYAIGPLREALVHLAAPPPFFWPPGYPLLVSLLSLVVGPTPLAGQLVSLAAGALVPVCTALLAREVWEERAAPSRGPGWLSVPLLAGLVAACQGQLWQSSVVVMADTSGLAAATLGVWALARYGRAGSLAWLLLAAAALAWAVLTRWIYGLVALPGAVYALLVLARRRPPAALAHGLSAALAAGLILGPVLVPVLDQVAGAAETAPFVGNWQVYSWHPLNALGREFETVDGHLAYSLPNGLYYALAPAHWYFFTPILAPLLLPGLWAAARHGSAALLLLIVGWAAVVYGFHAGAPWQNFRFTLAYLPPLAVLVAIGAAHVRQVAGRRLDRSLGLYLASGLVMMAIGGALLTHGFIERKQADLAIVRWVEAQAPPGGWLLTFGLTPTVRHYSRLEAVDLFELSEPALAALLADGRPALLLVDVGNIEWQWRGRPPFESYRWLRDGPGLTSLGSRGSYTLEGLRNGTTYQVAVRAVDDAGNVSATSNVLEATPQRVFDFWETYKNAGGAEDGGCSSAAGPAALGLLLSGLFVFRRRNGRR